MKKILFFPIVLVVISFLTTGAQTTQGSWALGLHNFSVNGTGIDNMIAPATFLGFSTGTQKIKYHNDYYNDEMEAKFTMVGLGLNTQYFIVNNFSGGMTFSFFTQYVKGKGDDEAAKMTLFHLSPELRCFIPIKSSMKGYVMGKVGLGSVNQSDTNTDLRSYGGELGLAFFPSRHFSVDTGIGYQFFKTSHGSDGSDYETNTGGFYFDLGFTVYLSKSTE